MSELDIKIFKQGMMMMCAVANREPTEILLDTYYALLKDLSEDQFQSAVTHVLSDRQYTNLPIPANIREAAIGKLDDEALIALAKLERAMPTWGAYRSIIFDDPIIHAIVQSMGGWVKVCVMPDDEWKFRRIEFLKTYKAFAPNLNRLQVPFKLVGIDESDNPTLPPKIAYAGSREKIDAWQGSISMKQDRGVLITGAVKALRLEGVGKC